MKIKIVGIGDTMPKWVGLACNDYLHRLPNAFQPKLIAVPRPKGANKEKDKSAQLKREAKALLAKVLPGESVIALDSAGESLTTSQWAQQMQNWNNTSSTITFLIGGSDGLGQDCIDRAQQRWSLSALTFPHMLVRVIVLEQLYRAWSILNHHPYHK